MAGLTTNDCALIARYDLAVELNSFDYYGWQAQVAAMGATEIVFDASSLADRDGRAWQRFHSIIRSGPEMLGLAWRYGTDGPTLASSRFRYLCAWARDRKTFPRLRSVQGTGPHEYTVTIRRQRTKTPARNSNDAAWRTFAAEIGACVIEDYDDVPITMNERIKLYAGARMNFGIVCGPLAPMCQLSIYPCVTFGWGWCWGNGFYEKAGIEYGQNMPWCGPDQHTVWEGDDLDVIRKWFAQWRRTCG